MLDLDAAYQREQLLLEVLLDIRDAIQAAPAPREPPPASIRWRRSTRSAASPSSADREGSRMRRTLLAAVCPCCSRACGPKADTVMLHGMVWTGLSSGAAQPGAVAIRAGKILAVGDSADIARYVGSGTQVVDAHGGLVLPGSPTGTPISSTAAFSSRRSICATRPRPRSSSAASPRSRRRGSRASGSSAAIGTTRCGRASPCRAASGSTRSRPTTPCSSRARWSRGARQHRSSQGRRGHEGHAHTSGRRDPARRPHR